MHFSFVTLFPEFFETPLKIGVVGQSFEKGKVTYSAINPREFATHNVHKSVDDRPFGGGDGMVMMAEPLAQSIDQAKAAQSGAVTKVINFSPQGRPLTQPLVAELAQAEHLIFVCGRYAGTDERLNQLVDLELSIGDFVLSGGEPAALCVVDSVCRLLPNTLGNELSPLSDSFNVESIFEAPLYTRPAEWRGMKVPDALLSGHHKKIEEFRMLVGLARVIYRRPELADSIDQETKTKALEFVSKLSPVERKVLGLPQ